MAFDLKTCYYSSKVIVSSGNYVNINLFVAEQFFSMSATCSKFILSLSLRLRLASSGLDIM